MKDSIILYSMPGCPKCRGLKMQLDKASISYEEKHDAELLMSKQLLNPPYLFVNGEFLDMAAAIKWIKGERA